MQKKAIFVALILILVFGMYAMVSAEDGDPQIEVVGTIITTEGGGGTEGEPASDENPIYFELSLHVAADKFRSAGLALQYPADILIPIQWNGADYGADYQAANTWESAVALDTRCPDHISAKPALAYTASDGNDSIGYVAFSAATTEPRSLEDGPIIALRFKLANGYTEADIEMGQNIRFIEDDDVTFLSNVQHSVLLHDDEGFYYYNPLKWSTEENKAVPNAELQPQLTFEAPAPFRAALEHGSGMTGTGGGSADDFITVTFFDWDETYIGSTLIQKAANPAAQARNAEVALQAFETANEDTLTAKKGYDFKWWIPYESTEPTSYGERVVSDNAGTMARENEQEYRLLKLVEPQDTVEAADITSNVTVKAAYTTNEECVIGPSAIEREYSTDIAKYGRYGTGNYYPLQIKIMRGDVPRPANPVLRVIMTVEGTDLISVFPLKGSDVEYVEIIPFSTNNGGVTKVTWAVVDSYGFSNVSGSAARISGNNSTVMRGTQRQLSFDGGNNRNVWVDEPNTFLHQCILGGINTSMEEHNPDVEVGSGSLPSINAIILRSIGIGLGPYSSNILGAKKVLYAAWQEKNYTDEQRNDVIVGLTREEIIAALGTQNESAQL